MRATGSDDGSAGVSTAVATLGMILLLGLGLAGMRVFTGASDLQAAAQSAARAAALEHTMGEAQAAARTVAFAELGLAGDACENPNIQVLPGVGGFEPGGTVVVEMSCDVSYDALHVLGVTGGSRPITVRAVEPIDCLRGGGSAALDITDNCYYGG